MSLVTSGNNYFKLEDRTNDLLLVPQSWTLLTELGLFTQTPIVNDTVTFEVSEQGLYIIPDQIRGAKAPSRAGKVRKIRKYTTTHNPVQDALYPRDLIGVTRPGSKGQEVDTKAAALMRKMAELRRSFAVTREVAAFKTLSTGVAWAPNGTVVADFYADAGLTQTSVNFALGTATTDVIDKCNQVIAGFQAAATEGQVINRVVGFAGSAFMRDLLAHNKVNQTWVMQTLAGRSNITQDRAGGMGLYRRFDFGGIEFIEVNTVLAGNKLVADDECIFVAMGDADAFSLYTSPPERFGYENTFGELEYMWTFEDQRGTEVTIEAESNFLHTLRKPNFVSKGTRT